MTDDLSGRKADHLTLCAEGDVGFRARTTLLEQVTLVHDALPELDLDGVDTSTLLLGKRLRAPILIAAMTGGTERAGHINRELAGLAEELGYGFGLGSQRAMHVREGTLATYQIRDVAPTTLVLGNLGVVQAGNMTSGEIAAMASAVGADALCVHLNPAMELVQPGGDRDFRGGQATVGRLVRELPVPVVVKETGCGLSYRVGTRLRALGVRHVDVSGAGGTSWVAVETERAAHAGDAGARAIGEAFRDWGIPTAASVLMMARAGLSTVIATGGVGTGLEIAKALALGATAAGIARPVLRALEAGGRQGARAFLEGVERELRTAMLLTGSRTVDDLRRADRVLGPELGAWLAASPDP